MSKRASAWAASALALFLACGLLIALRSVRDTRPSPKDASSARTRLARSKAAAVETQREEESANPVRATEPASTNGRWVLRGRVVRRAAAEEAVPNALVRLAPGKHRGDAEVDPAPLPEPRQVTTDADGRFKLADVPARTPLLVEVDAPGFALERLGLALADIKRDTTEPRTDGEPEATDLGDIVVEAAHELRVLLVTSSGKTIEDGKVSATPSGKLHAGPLRKLGVERAEREAERGSAGEHAIERLAPGTYTVRGSAPGFQTSSEEVTLPRDEPLVLHLDAGLRIAGLVRSSAGEPIPGAFVALRYFGDPPDDRVETDVDGRFVFDTLSEDEYVFTATAEGFSSLDLKAEAGTEQVEFWLFREALVSGTVLAEDGDAPIKGADVSLVSDDRRDASFHSETDRGGTFEIRKVSPGSYRLIVDHGAYLPVEVAPLRVEEGGRSADLTLRLWEGLEQSGKVVSLATGEPIDGATIKVWRRPSDNEPACHREGMTGSDGTFVLRGVSVGEYEVQVRVSGFRLNTSQHVHGTKDLSSWMIEMDEAAGFAGIVLDPDGHAVEGAKILLDASSPCPREVARRIQFDTPSQTESDSMGRFGMENLPAFQDYRLRVQAKGFLRAHVNGIDARPGSLPNDIVVRLETGNTIRGRVLDERGRSIPRTEVRARSESERPRSVRNREGREVKVVEATEEGTFELADLDPGAWSIAASTPGRPGTRERKVTLRKGADLDGVDLAFEGGAELSGRVVDAGGRPIAGANVVIADNGVDGAVTDAEGLFRFSGLRPGATWIDVSKKGFLSSRVQVHTPADGIEVRLQPCARLMGRAVVEGRKSLPSGTVKVEMQRGASRETTLEASTDETGRFNIPWAEPGKCVITVEVPGFARGVTELTLSPGEAREMLVPLRSSGTVEGVVVWKETGEPVRDARVAPLEVSGTLKAGLAFSAASTDEQGRFSIDDVPAGPAALVVKSGFHRIERIDALAVVAGWTTRIRIELSRAQGLRGCVKHEGAPVAGAMVTACRKDAIGSANRASAVAEVDTIADGSFEMLELPAGTYEVLVKPPGAEGTAPFARRRADISEGEVTDMEIDLASVVLEGRLLGGRGRGDKVTVRVHCLSHWNFSGEAWLDRATGDFSLELPSSGEYVITAFADDVEVARVPFTAPPSASEVRMEVELPD